MAETAYEDRSVDELREEAKRRGMSGIWEMDKRQLVEALQRAGSGSGSSTAAEAGAGPVQEEDHPGQTLVTEDHEVIRSWAERRGAKPATVPGTEHEGRAGVLRLDFPGYGGQDLQEITWDQWFETFDARGLRFIYQEHRKDGNESNFFRLENPDREDA